MTQGWQRRRAPSGANIKRPRESLRTRWRLGWLDGWLVGVLRIDLATCALALSLDPLLAST